MRTSERKEIWKYMMKTGKKARLNLPGEWQLMLALILLTLLWSTSVTHAEISEFRSAVPETGTRYWIGPDFWGVNLDHWYLEDGWIVNRKARDHTQLHVLTRDLIENDGFLEMSVRLQTSSSDEEGAFAGFVFAAIGGDNEYRDNLEDNTFVRVGLTGQGELAIGDSVSSATVSSAVLGDAHLHFRAECLENRAHIALAVRAGTDPDGEPIATFSHTVEHTPLVGNLALTANGRMDCRFKDWVIRGDKVAKRPERRFGPVLWTQYTLHDKTMKMTAFMPDLTEQDAQTVALEVRDGTSWNRIAEEKITPWPYDVRSAWTRGCRMAHFRIENWDDNTDHAFRVAYEYRDANGTSTMYHEGVVRRDPKDKDTVTLGVVTGMGHFIYPNHYLEENLLVRNPDLMFFSGDNIYGGSYIKFGWRFRDLLRDRPSICTPDDHDVGNNDLWGRGGIEMPDTVTRSFGGYRAGADKVNFMHDMQTAHHPDPAGTSSAPISVYYTDLTYGRISFGIVDDRQFKSSPTQALDAPVGHDNYGNMEKIKADRDYDVSQLDKPGLKLLGDDQIAFLEQWTADWRGADMKMLLHQSPFCQSANYGGGDWPPDLDANGWPQSARNRALRTIRKGFVATASGDTHLGMLIQQGVEDWGDAAWQFVCPAGTPVSNRSWNPGYTGENHQSGMPAYTGDYYDAFDNKMTVQSVANPNSPFSRAYRTPDGSQLDDLQSKVAGYGIVRFSKPDLTYTFECYPLYANLESSSGGEQFPDWPVTVSLGSNYGKAPFGYLEEVSFGDRTDPAVQLVSESGEIIYSRRVRGDFYAPPVFSDGTYTVKFGEIGGEDIQTITNLRPIPLSEIGKEGLPPSPDRLRTNATVLIRGSRVNLLSESPTASDLRLSLFSSSGRLIRRIRISDLQPGRHVHSFDLNPEAPASGVLVWQVRVTDILGRGNEYRGFSTNAYK